MISVSRLRAAWLLLCLTAPIALSEQAILFEDVAQELGITARNTFGGLERKDYILETTGNGVAIFDFDNDGQQDVLLLNGTTIEDGSARTPRLPSLYRNQGSGKFVDITKDSGLGEEGWAQAVCAGDYDNDGFTDLLITYYGHNRLYRNTGGQRPVFADVTAKARMPLTGTRFGSGCTFFDYNRDGRLDLFVANYVNLDLKTTPKPGQGDYCVWKEIPVMCGPRGLPLAKNSLYRQEPNGAFTDVSGPAGILTPGGRYALQAVAADFDGDGWPDIYVACDMTPSLLFRNRRNGTFDERGVEAGVSYNAHGRLQAGMGVAIADFNNDGRLDIAKTNFSGDLTSLYLNEDGKFFSDVSAEAGLGVRQLLGWGVAFADFDDDGWRDLLTVNGHVYPEVDRAPIGERYRQLTLLFHNTGKGKFEDWTARGGPALATARPARGLAVGDLDGDGRPEALILNMNDAPSVLKNTKPGGRFLNIALRGARGNLSAIGARVTVHAGSRTWMDEVQSGSSFYSQNSFVLHFGLGDAGKVDRVTVRWPNGTEQAWSGLPVNSLCRLQEGQADAGCRAY
ncbi:MAG: CRTAC1 family protein [Acidobacteria bacterium]|nr:CRTAC1 family protein [Acidobacteriota bacterium]